MKNLLCALMAIVFFLPHTQGQTLAYTKSNSVATYDVLSAAYPNHSSRYATGMTVAGIISMGVGAAAVVVGVIEYDKGETPRAFDHRRADLGIILMAAGSIIFVDGGLTVISGVKMARANHKLTIISPKKNQLGLAYNF